MKVSIITDEVSADPETAIELGVGWGVQDFELRGVFNDRAPLLSDHAKRSLCDILQRYQAHIVAVGPGLFKIPFPPTQPRRASLAWLDKLEYDRWSEAQRLLHFHQSELLPASLDYAAELGAGRVVIFGFDRAGAPPSNPPEELLGCLLKAAERAQSYGLKLVVENEAGFWADTGQHTAQIVKAVNHPALEINWDPGNAFFAGDTPYPNGYQPVRGLIGHVHFKDARRGPDGKPQYCAQGQIDWAGQVAALLADRFSGYISVETHLRPKVSTARVALDRLRNLIRQASGG